MGNKNTSVSDPTAEDETASLLAKAPNPVEGTSNFPTMGNTNTSVSDPTVKDKRVQKTVKDKRVQKTVNDKIASLVAEAPTPVVIFSITTSTIRGTVESLFYYQLPVNPTVYILDQHFPNQLGKEMERALIAKNGSLPVVYIGGELVGDTDRVMDSLIKGDLTKRLKKVGVLTSQRFR